MTTRFRTCPYFRTDVFSFRECYLGPGEKNMRRFPKFRDPRFALTTLQNPNIEVRTYAQLVQAAQQAREWQARAAQYAALQPLATPAVPDSIPSAAFPENVASAAPDPALHAPFSNRSRAIKNARNSPETNALNFSNRLKTANCSARFSRVLRSSNRDSRHFYSIQIKLTKSPL
jgi:hypothetical protein